MHAMGIMRKSSLRTSRRSSSGVNLDSWTTSRWSRLPPLRSEREDGAFCSSSADMTVDHLAVDAGTKGIWSETYLYGVEDLGAMFDSISLFAAGWVS